MARALQTKTVRTALTAVLTTAALASFSLCNAAAATAQPAAKAVAGDKAGRAVSLPMNLADNVGNTYNIQMNGMVMQQNNNGMPGFGQMGNLIVNGQGIGMRMINPGMPGGGPSARVDDKTGELTISNLQVAGLSITRRIWVDKDNGAVRFVDSFKNTGNAEVNTTVMSSSMINYGIQQGRPIAPDAKRRGEPVGWVGQTNGRGVFCIWGFTGGKTMPRVTAQENMNQIQGTTALKIPAGGEVALVSLLGNAETVERAGTLVDEMKLSKFVAGLPAEVRRLLVNVPIRSGGFTIGFDLLHVDGTDALETASGDQLRGTLTDKTFALKTRYGRVELPADKLVGLATVGRQQPTQLLITDEGEIYAGELEGDGISLQLADGQTIKVQLKDFSRAGYHRKPVDGGEASGEIKPLLKPWIAMRSGERIAVAAATEPLPFASRYGLLKIPADKIATVLLRPEETSVHIITLVDGSRFSGFLTTADLAFTLDGAGGKGAGPATFPVNEMVLYCPTVPTKDDDTVAATPSEASELRCTGDDLFYGTLTGKLQLDTPYQLIEVAADGVRTIQRVENSRTDVKVILWDGSTMTGMLRGMALPMKLVSGAEVLVPVDLLSIYENAKPRPSAAMGDKVKSLIAKLNDEDFKAREAAQKELIASGAVIAPMLKEMREGQPLEAQQRIDQILAAFEK